MAGAVTGGHFGLLPVRFLSRPIGATVLLTDMSGRMGGNQRATLRIAAARITVSPLAVTRLATTGRRHGGWIGGIRCDDSLWLFTGSRRRLMGRCLCHGNADAAFFCAVRHPAREPIHRGTGRNIRGNIMRQHSNVTGFTVTPVFLPRRDRFAFPLFATDAPCSDGFGPFPGSITVLSISPRTSVDAMLLAFIRFRWADNTSARDFSQMVLEGRKPHSRRAAKTCVCDNPNRV